MVLTRCSPRLTINNTLNGLCDVMDEQVGPMAMAMAKQMVHKMQLVASIHKTLLENVEQVQNKEAMKNVCLERIIIV